MALEILISRRENLASNLRSNIAPWVATLEAGLYYNEARSFRRDKPSASMHSMNLQAWQAFTSSVDRRFVFLGCAGGFIFFVGLNCTSLSIALNLEIQPDNRIKGVIIGVLLMIAGLILGLSNFHLSRIYKTRETSLVQWPDLILSRDATQAKDKAFGVHAILQASLIEQLPAPDYSLPMQKIQRDLCLIILKATQSLRFLLPASINQASGSPTWVPNWTEPCGGFWGNTSLLWPIGRAKWQYSPTDGGALTVLARQIGVVDTALAFRTDSADFEGSNPYAASFENLRIMILLMQSLTDTSDDTLADTLGGPWTMRTPFWTFFEHLWDMTATAIEAPHERVTRDELLIWAATLYTRWRHIPRWITMLQIHGWTGAAERQNFYRPRTFYRLALLGLTKRVCARFARNGCSLLLYRRPDDTLRWMLGRQNTRIGDRIVSIYGAGLFVVRGDLDGARLISPAAANKAVSLEEQELIKIKLI